MTSNAVSVLPPTGGIKDSATREFLDALTNMLDARSGYTNKDAPERFITAAEFQGLTNRALIQAFSSGGISPGSPGGGIPSAKEINDAIDNLADFIRKSLIYQKLGEQIDLIDISSLRQRVQELGTGIYREEVVRKDADLQLASSITTLQAGLDNSSVAIQQELETRAARDLALAKAINTIWAAVGGSQAVIQDGALASATPNSAQATKWDQVVASVTDPNTGLVNSTSIKQELNTYASNADGKFNSIYSVRAQVSTGGQTVVGGFGLSATAGASSGEGPTIDFGVRADKFFIAATSETPDAPTQIAQGSAIPFMVLTSPQVVNGVTYAPGVYIKKATIGAASIGTAEIAELAVTTAKIQNAAIDTAKIRDLAVDTFKIAGEAITVPRGASGSNQIFLQGLTWETVLTLPPIDTLGGAVYLAFSTKGSDGTNFVGEGEVAVPGNILVQLRRNGVVIFSGSGFSSQSMIDNPGEGANFYSLHMAGAAGNGGPNLAYVNERTFVAIGCKR